MMRSLERSLKLDKMLFTHVRCIYCYIVQFCLLLNSIPFRKPTLRATSSILIDGVDQVVMHTICTLVDGNSTTGGQTSHWLKANCPVVSARSDALGGSSAFDPLGVGIKE
jgi:hypothetical protein